MGDPMGRPKLRKTGELCTLDKPKGAHQQKNRPEGAIQLNNQLEGLLQVKKIL